MKEHIQLLLRATTTDLTITYPRIINYIACAGNSRDKPAEEKYHKL